MTKFSAKSSKRGPTLSKIPKLSIKNKQLAESLNLGKLKNKLNKKKENDADLKEEKKKKAASKVEPKLKKTEDKKEAAPIRNTQENTQEPVLEKEKAKETPKNRSPDLEPTVEISIEENKPFTPKSTSKPTKSSKKRGTFTSSRPVKLKKSAPEPEPEPQPEPPKEKKPEDKVNQKDLELLEKSGANLESRSNFKKGAKGDKPLGRLGKANKGYQDLPPLKRSSQPAHFDSRSRQGLVSLDEGSWQRRRRKPLKQKRSFEEDKTIRPASLSIRVPISIKNLASAMKLKASELITVLFKHGLTLTLNDYLDDETTLQLLGHEFNCEISLNTAEQERIQVTDKTLGEEIKGSKSGDLKSRPPVIAFMGHVDHGKTSLIDAIRKSNRVAYEAGAITQHIGAFQCSTSHGPITVLDTPGHEAFSAMRNRGANVTDIVVLVVAGDEGIKEQTVEAIQHAKEAQVTTIVAINKADKDGYNPENVYRELSEHGLIAEQWGGSTVMVNCSAKTGQGIADLLELIALQSEVLELVANPSYRARGMVLESEIHKGFGNVASLIVQNGTLNVGDAVVFDQYYARIKTMINDLGENVQHATPSMPIEITGISGLPEAGTEFIVVKDEKEAKTIADMRYKEFQKDRFASKKKNLQESFLADTSDKPVKKILPLIIRADVQGSLEALKQSLKKIKSEKIDLLIIDDGVGEVTESDIQLAKTAKASIIGFHTRIESHAEELMKSINIKIKMPKIIYEAVDQVKEMMVEKLDKVAHEEDKGKAEVRAVFKSSKIGRIAGCSVVSGNIHRNHHARVIRNGEQIWKGTISSLKREKEDVKELKKDMECGIVLNGFNQIEVGDMIESFEVTYLTQTL